MIAILFATALADPPIVLGDGGGVGGQSACADAIAAADAIQDTVDELKSDRDDACYPELGDGGDWWDWLTAGGGTRARVPSPSCRAAEANLAAWEDALDNALMTAFSECASR